MCSISVEPMPSMIRDAGRVVERLPGRRAAGARRPRPQRRSAAQLARRRPRQHRPVRGRRGEQHRDAGARATSVGELRPASAFSSSSVRGADAQREHQQAAEAEGERQRRRAGEDVVRARPAARAGRRCRRSPARRGGSAWSPSGAPVVPEVKASSATSSAAVSTSSNVARLAARPGGEVVGAVAAVGDHRQRRVGRGQLVGEPVVAQRQAGRAISRDRGAARRRAAAASVVTATPPALSTAEPAGDQPRVVRAAQQHPVARDEAEVVGQHVRDLVGAARAARRRSRSAVGGDAGRAGPGRARRRRRRAARRRSSAAPGSCSSGRSNSSSGHCSARRQVVPAEGVDVRRRRELHAGPIVGPTVPSVCSVS